MSENYIMIPVPESKIGAVYALIGSLMAGASIARGSTASEAVAPKPSPVVENTTATEPIADASGEASTGEVDAAGTPFDPARHTGTKVKSGLWRLKAGVARLPGEELPAEGAGAPNGAAAGASQSSGSTSTGGAPVVAEDDDEFAAFAAAAAPATAKARTWTDTDLSKLANQAATKLGSPDKVKATIAKHVPEGLTPHSRNIPADKREAFAVDLEAVAGIEYAG
jgi:hypothetical protein